MKRKSSIITAISVSMIIIALLLAIFLENVVGNKIFEIISVITAVIGAVALFYQFKKDKDLNKASFVMEYSKSFFNEYDLGGLFSKLDDDYDNPKSTYKFNVEKERESFIKYVMWIESLSAIILDGVINIASIDKALGYRFFLLVNNKEVQKQEIIPFIDLYEGTCILYDMWYKYRKAHNIPIPNEKNSLHLVEGFDDILKNNRK